MPGTVTAPGVVSALEPAMATPFGMGLRGLGALRHRRPGPDAAQARNIHSSHDSDPTLIAVLTSTAVPLASLPLL